VNFQYIEEELRNYPQTVKALENRKMDIIESSPNEPDVKVKKTKAGNPTEICAIKLTSLRILRVESTIRAIESVLKRLDNTDKDFVRMFYWEGKSRLYVIDELFQGERSTYQYRKKRLISMFADALGIDV
jgi:RinA family phage transcriptional activator